MKGLFTEIAWIVVLMAWIGVCNRAAGQYAVQVMSYDAGVNPAIEFGSGLPYSVKEAALGEPSRFIPDDDFPSVVSVFSGPYQRNQIVSIGAGGHLTLRLSHFALPAAPGPHVGVFTNVGVADSDWPNGLAGDPVTAFGVDAANVEVSEDGLAWEDLGAFEFNLPTNGYTDAAGPFATMPGSVPSDFQQPFTGALDDFAGLTYGESLGLLAGSGGGMWLDLSGAGLTEVGFIRFSVPADADWNFELDAVSIAHGALGAVTIPEPASLMLAAWALASLAVRFRRRLVRRAA